MMAVWTLCIVCRWQAPSSSSLSSPAWLLVGRLTNNSLCSSGAPLVSTQLHLVTQTSGPSALCGSGGTTESLYCHVVDLGVPWSAHGLLLWLIYTLILLHAIFLDYCFTIMKSWVYSNVPCTFLHELKGWSLSGSQVSMESRHSVLFVCTVTIIYGQKLAYSVWCGNGSGMT